MTARRLIALFAAIVIGLTAAPVKADERAQVEVLIQYYAQYYGLPLELVRRVVNRESTFNPRARNGPYWGLMQIRHDTAQTMGYRGPPEGLLDAETNLIYAVKYLRGAYLVAGGNQDRAVQHYARGYYYHARDMGLLEETGLRPGPKSPVAPTPPSQLARAQAQPAPPPPPQEVPAFESAVAGSVDAAAGEPAPQPLPAEPEIFIVAALPAGTTPPQRPADLAEPPGEAVAAHESEPGVARPDQSEALVAIAEVAVPEADPGDPHAEALAALRPGVAAASAYFATMSAGAAQAEDGNIFEATFGMLDALNAAIAGRTPDRPRAGPTL